MKNIDFLKYCCLNKRWFFDIKYCLVKQLSCIYNKYHCLSGVCGTHGNKSGPVTGLVREACPVC